MSTYFPQNFTPILPRTQQIQNETFFIQEFYNTFIEKIINEFDMSGEINLYWHQLKQKISEEKNFQQLYKYILNLEIKKREQSKQDLFDLTKYNADYAPSSQAISSSKLPKEDELFIKKTPTSVRTVSIQFDMLSKMNSTQQNGSGQKDIQQVETSSQQSSPKSFSQRLPSLTILKNISCTNQKYSNDNPYGNFSPQNANSSFSNNNSPQLGGKNCFKILENIRKRNSSPSYTQYMCFSPLQQKPLSQGFDSNYKTCASQKQLTLETITDITQEKNQKDCEKSFSIVNDKDNNNTKQKEQKNNKLKRFSPQQIIRMGSIREAEDEVIENTKDNEQKESVSKMLALVISAKNTFKLDSETINLIHGKFSLAYAQNCKNSMGHEQFKAHAEFNNKIAQIGIDQLKKPTHKLNNNEFNIEINNKYQNNNTFLIPQSPKKKKNSTPVRDKYFPK
ncbi:hypothetical protein TTHERM_00239200 (macronuclear) [Tetrahymena thermophila SB210]|uniref:Uncharacterized protein n=1 Tax=Tetrahymena thermophila (strain SB210) TaxID=312017 RepID=I7MMC7_TETTS|nr:hypothetical protein TTHERM_00239200 [Tetrahymena thermophila SB210]EAS04599.2 hypothetical protein TTHERM_00239200 [Tetrahymena thermophila SB210]|eukprot:XP_001024844.2 hypothetical protein TTHERM_00239200 [Tetrahymena thermophila SB210]